MYLSSRNVSIALFVIHALFGVPSQAIQNRGQYIHIADMQFSDKTDPGTIEHREKRQVSKVTKGALNALKKLLQNSIKGPTAGHMVRYIKLGNLETAMKDFYSIKPQAVRQPPSGYYISKGIVLFGHVGDYRIRLIEKGTQDGRHPILEFTDTRKASAGPGVHRIVYKTHDKRLKEKPESP